MNHKRLETAFEFLIFGIVIGIVEDLLAVVLTTGQPITWTMIGIIVLIAVPFAFLGEYISYKVNFTKIFNNSVKYIKNNNKH